MDEHDRIINWLTRRTADEMEVAAAEAITRLRAELEKLSRNDLPGMCEAFDRVIEAYHSKAHPFHNPLADDARTALRVLRGICSTITALAAKE